MLVIHEPMGHVDPSDLPQLATGMNCGVSGDAGSLGNGNAFTAEDVGLGHLGAVA